MTLHLLKLVWNRKRANALVIAEIFFSFLVVFAVITLIASMVTRWSLPLGFSRDDIWIVQFDNVGDMPDPHETDDDSYRKKLGELIREAKTFPQVVDAAAAMSPPYSMSTSSGVRVVDGKRVEVTRDEVSDGYLNVMKIKLLRGRWFVPGDDAAGFRPAVVDTNFAAAIFGAEDPIGKDFDYDGNMVRIVGIVAPFRKDGEFTSPDMKMVFRRVSFAGKEDRVPRNMAIRVRPGTSADFERTLSDRLHSVAPAYSFRIRRMDGMRNVAHRIFMVPAIAGGIVASFLMSMVALGLTGVLWQTVTRRIRELGLRRSLGATGVRVRKQILAEVALLSTFAALLGVVVVLQLPLLGLLTFVTPQVFAFGIVTGLMVIYVITLLCGVYPAWMASRIEPADALRHE